MKIFDCSIFFNELELLELRFMELYDTVDYFILVEANATHTGKPKEFIFEANKGRYERYLDKVIYVKVEDCPEYSAKKNDLIENFQRNAIMRGLVGTAVSGDKILISDLDEIPRTEMIVAHKNKPGNIFFQPDMFYYYVNCRVVRPWGGAVMTDYGATMESPQRLRRFAIRNSAYVGDGNERIITHAGWHYSYLAGGDPEKIRNKVENIYESSVLLDKLGTNEEILEKMKRHLDPYGRGLRRTEEKIIDISKTKPKSMDAFLKKYPHFFYEKKPEKIFLDIGAWKGDTAQSVLTSKHDFDKIYCFEPQPDLCDTIRAFNNPKIIVEEFGLWNKTATVPLYTDATKKTGRITDGATVYEDKFSGPKNTATVRMMKADDWFCKNLDGKDYIVMKMNCEGAECDILEDLMNSGEFDKVNALMVDFDVRKVPSQTQRESELRERLKAYDIPMYIVDRYDQWRLRGINATHHWMDKIL